MQSEIQLVGRPARRVDWLARMVVREVQILFWLGIAVLAFPVFLVRRRTLGGASGAAVAFLFRRLGATFIKVGEIMSTRADMFSPEFLAPLVDLLRDRGARRQRRRR